MKSVKLIFINIKPGFEVIVAFKGILDEVNE